MVEKHHSDTDKPRYERGSWGEAFAALAANAPSLTDDLVFYLNWYYARIREALVERKKRNVEREK